MRNSRVVNEALEGFAESRVRPDRKQSFVRLSHTPSERTDEPKISPNHQRQNGLNAGGFTVNRKA
jgi:hypothetical protein